LPIKNKRKNTNKAKSTKLITKRNKSEPKRAIRTKKRGKSKAIAILRGRLMTLFPLIFSVFNFRNIRKAIMRKRYKIIFQNIFF